jgi:hypothetical protein
MVRIIALCCPTVGALYQGPAGPGVRRRTVGHDFRGRFYTDGRGLD